MGMNKQKIRTACVHNPELGVFQNDEKEFAGGIFLVLVDGISFLNFRSGEVLVRRSLGEDGNSPGALAGR